MSFSIILVLPIVDFAFLSGTGNINTIFSYAHRCATFFIETVDVLSVLPIVSIHDHVLCFKISSLHHCMF